MSESLHFEADLDLSKLEAGINKMESRIKSLESSIGSSQAPYSKPIPSVVIGSFDQLSMKAQYLKEKMDAINPDSKEWNEYNEALKKTQKAINDLPKPGKQIDPSVIGSFNQLSAKAIDLKSKMDAIDPKSSEWKTYNKSLQETKQKMDAIGDSSQKTSNMMSGLGGVLGGVFAAVGVGQLASSIIDVTSEFQKYEAVLTNSLGSEEAAAKAMSDIKEFAATTPFQLNELTDSYIKLTGRGLQPSIDGMTKMGDFAASSGKSMDQLTEAILDGANPERWKEFGVAAKVNGDMATLSFRGMTVEVANSAEGARKAVEEFNKIKGVSGTMAAVSQTMGGQISNLQDKISNMFNEMGQANDGFITGAIGGIGAVVDNYESILEILGVLVATYGTYKAVLMLTAAAQKASVAAEQIKNFMLMTKAIQGATVAQEGLNVAQKANVIGLAIAGIVALVGVVMLLREKTKSASEAQQDFNDLQSQVKDNKSQEDMIARYDELAAKTNKSAAEQAEYNKLITSLSEIYPQAITKVNEHGEAIALNTEKMKNANAEQKKALEILAKDQLEDVDKALAKAQKKYDSSKEDIESGDGSAKDAKKLMKYAQELESLKKTKSGLQKELGIPVTVDAGVEVVASEPKKEEIKKTVSQQISSIKKEIDSQQKELTTMRSLSSTSTPKEIEAAENNLKSLKDQLEKITGVKAKEKKKDEISEQDKLKAQEELGKKQIELQNSIEAGRVAAMQDGTEKRKQEAYLALDQELAAIQEQEKAYIETYNTSKGLKKGDKGYITTVPVDQQSSFDNLKVQAEAKNVAAINKINSDAAKERLSIQKKANESFITEHEKQVDSVNEKYDELVEKAKENGESTINIAAINTQRQKELNEIEVSDAVSALESEEQAELESADNSIKNEQKLNEKKLQIQKNYLLKKIEALKKSGTEESKVQLKAAESELLAVNNQLAGGANERLVAGLDDASEILGGMTNLAGQIDDEFGNVVGTMSDMSAQASNIATNVIEGNWVGVIAGGLSLVGDLFGIMKDDSEAQNAIAEHYNEILAERIDLLVNAGMITIQEGQLANLELLKTDLSKKIKQIGAQEIEVYYSYLDDNYMPQIGNTFVNIGQMMKDVYGSTWGSEELQAFLSDSGNILSSYTGFDVTGDELIRVQELANELLAIQGEINGAMSEFIGFTGDNLASSIADGIMNGFKLGADGALGDFTDSFKDLLKKAALNALTTSFNSQYFAAIQSKMTEAMNATSSGGTTVTEDEIAAMQTIYSEGISAMQASAEAWNLIIGDTAATTEDANGLSGSIKASLTEETGSLLAGKINSMQTHVISISNSVAEMRSIAVSQLESLRTIAGNTSYNWHLQSMAGDIAALKKYQSTTNEVLNQIAANTGGVNYEL